MVRQVRPARLMVVADGPRENVTGDSGRCQEVRSILNQGVDWPCDVSWNLADRNLGCGRRMSSGLDWVFGQVPEAIVLEDDCLPDPTFFHFCTELLARYRDDERVGQICGSIFIAPRLKRTTSYVFSRYGPGWGWASWARAWATYDFSMHDWPAIRAEGGLRRLVRTEREARMRTRLYDALATGAIDTWDFQWTFAKLRHRLLSVIPATNLVANIGFGPDATHTVRAPADPHAAEPMEFPLVHPSEVRWDDDYDARFAGEFAPSWLARISRKLRRIAP